MIQSTKEGDASKQNGESSLGELKNPSQKGLRTERSL